MNPFARGLLVVVLAIAALATALLFVSERAEAEKEPEWNHTTGDDVLSVAISADGEHIAAGSDDTKVYLFEQGSSTPLWSYTTGGYVHSVAISADGEYLAAGSHDEKVYLFEQGNSTPLWSYTTGGEVYSVAIAADGEHIAAGSEDNKVYLFKLGNSTPLWSHITGGWVISVAISADGEYLAVGSMDNKVYLFEQGNSTPLWSYTTGSDVRSVAISANGEYLAAGSGDTKVYLFEQGSSTPLWTYTNGEGMLSVAISADGEYLTAGSGDTKVYLFDKNIPPTANIESISPSPANEGDTVSFSGSGWDDDGSVVSYQWHSDIDGNLSTLVSFFTDSISAGDHIISFRIQDNDGAWSNWAINNFLINAKPSGQIKPISYSNFYYDSCQHVVIINYTAQAEDPDGSIVLFRWDFDGDGTYDLDGTVPSITYTFNVTAPFNYTTRLIVQDNNGAWSEGDTIGLGLTELGECENTPQADDDDDGGFLPAPSLLLSLGMVVMIMRLQSRFRR